MSLSLKYFRNTEMRTEEVSSEVGARDKSYLRQPLETDMFRAKPILRRSSDRQS